MMCSRSRSRCGVVGLVVIWLVFEASTISAQPVTIRGFVTDLANGQILPGANVTLVDHENGLTGAVTDGNGFYQISGIEPGEYVLRISFVGYEPYEDSLDLGAERFVTRSVALRPGDAALGEVVVESDRGAARREAGLQTIEPTDLARIPTPDVSGDLAAYLQSLPGIVSLGDRGGRLYVRGGTPAQNLVLVDGNLIYQPFHIVGFFSAFPQDLVSTVDMLAGGFGARYSGRISSVIDVTTRSGNTSSYQASASLSPFLTGVRVEGPLRRGRSSFLASYRSSVIDEVAPVISGREIPVDFGDMFLKLYRTDGVNDRCSSTLVRTRDRGQIDAAGEDEPEYFRWTNLVIGGKCLVFPAESRFLFEGNAGISYVGNEVGTPSDPDRSSYALQLQSDVHFTYRRRRSELRWGVFTRASWTGYELGGQFQDLDIDSDVLIGAGGYVDVETRRRRIKVNPGVAFTAYPFFFSPSIEPRLRFSWEPTLLRGGSFSGAAGIYDQTLVGVSDERDAGSLFMAWMPVPIGGRKSRAVHTLFGWQQPLAEWLSLSVEGYHKSIRNLAVPLWSTIARFTTALQLADGRSYGYDGRLEMDRGPVYLFAGYGYSVTRYEAVQENFGVWYGEPVQIYHPPHDVRHQLTLVAGYQADRFSVNVQWQFGSGLPYTRALGFDELIRMRPLMDYRRFRGTTRILFERPYRGRMPAYHRLDISLDRQFTSRAADITLQVGVINSYDRANIFYVDIFTLRRVDQLPLVPFAGIKIEIH